MLPNRPRSLTQLAYHLFNVADAFVEHEEGIPLTFKSYCREPAPGTMTKAELLAYGAQVRGPGRRLVGGRRADARLEGAG